MPYHDFHPDAYVFTPDDPAIKTPLESFYESLMEIRAKYVPAPPESWVRTREVFPTTSVSYTFCPKEHEITTQEMHVTMLTPSNLAGVSLMDIIEFSATTSKRSNAESLHTQESTVVRRYGRNHPGDRPYSSFILSILQDEKQTETKMEPGITTTVEQPSRKSFVDVIRPETVSTLLEEVIGKITMTLDQQVTTQ